MSDVEEITQMFHDDGIEAFYDVATQGDWIDNGKFSFSRSIIKYNDKYYQIDQTRSGSYFTDYRYDDPVVYEVTRRDEVIIQTVWDKV